MDIEFKKLSEQHQLTEPNLVKKPKYYRVMSQVLAVFGFGCLIFSVSAICTMPTVVNAGLNRSNDTTSVNGTIENKSVNSLDSEINSANTSLNDSNSDLDNLNESELHFTDQQASWFGSIVYMVQPLGALSSAFIQDKFGRRRCMMGVTIPQFVGWIVLYSATSTTALFVAVTIMSLSIGFMEAPAMSFIGETVEPKYRGVLSTFSQVFLLVGIVFEFVIGAIFPWREACLVSAVIPVIAFFAIYIVPESPVWLVVKGRFKEAEESLCWLRGWTNIEQIRDEYDQLFFNLNVGQAQDSLPLNTLQPSTFSEGRRPMESSTFSQVMYLTQSRVYKPLLMVASYFFICHCVSLNGLRPVQVKIFTELSLDISSYTALVIVGACLLAGAISCPIFIRKLGKRGLTFISLGGCCIFNLGLSAYFYWNSNIPYLGLALFALVYYFSGIGVLPLAWVLVCEVFPLDCRGIGAGLAAASCYIFAGLVTKTFLELRFFISLPGVLLVYGLIGIVGFIFLYFWLPETEGKTLQEIEVYFHKRKPKISSPD